ncbi:hypothetical protein OEZ85_007871 [Tetradesmus obliquus]|uniref:Uncharacterized protein n=1 Tax=Tetradesmus obliquus TaxID=3088 RepID=A0ABY8THR5_TETOB|nr:hypothetical protein OEZ85_007871 [Tetradesmus obliquus]
MQSRKRSFNNSAGECIVLQSPADSVDVLCRPHRDQQHKRSCGTDSNPAPGQLRQSDVQAFFNSLLAPYLHNVPSPQALAAYSGLDEAGWQSFAELNALMGQCYHKLPSGALRGYHSFTTQERSALWLNYAKAHHVPAEAATAPAPVAYSPRHLQLVRFLLEWVMSSAADASLTEYTIELPDWMVGYAARWGWGQSSIKLLVLQGYPAMDPCCSRVSSSRAHCCRLFVPMSIA